MIHLGLGYVILMRRYRQAKIICTLGPKTERPEVIEKLFESGADVFRLNFSHGEREDQAKRISAIRSVRKEIQSSRRDTHRLTGSSFGVGKFENGSANLEKGNSFRFDLIGIPGDHTRICLPHPEIFGALDEGTTILLDDGKLSLTVEEAGKDYALTKITVGGIISDRKGVNIPNAVLPITAITDKDRSDLEFALDQEVDYIGLSFIQRPEDIREARKLIGNRALIMSKLENSSSIDHLDDIVAMSDAIMVARGDLGVEMPTEDVPILQRRIIRACRKTWETSRRGHADA